MTRPEHAGPHGDLLVELPKPERSRTLPLESLLPNQLRGREPLDEHQRDVLGDQARKDEAPDRWRRPDDSPEKVIEVDRPAATCAYAPGMAAIEYQPYLWRDPDNPIPVFNGEPRREQAAQGFIGDCGIIATIRAAAEHRPDALKKAVNDLGDGTFEVTLHQVYPASPNDSTARPTGESERYLVSDAIPVDPRFGDSPAYAKVIDSAWPVILEKVVAAEDATWDDLRQEWFKSVWIDVAKPWVDAERAKYGHAPSPEEPPRGYDRINLGSTPFDQANLLAKLTGESAEVRVIPTEVEGAKVLLDEFSRQIADGKPVLVGTRARLEGEANFPYILAAAHAYEVTKVEAGKIHLDNPWGFDHPEPLTPKDFWEYFQEYDRGGRSGGYASLV